MRRLTVVTGLLVAACAQAQDTSPGKGIYTCTTADGRRLTGDRPIPECTSREQRVLNPDGSQRATLPPFLSPEERTVKEAADRRAAAERIAQLDAIRRDRTLMQRYPNEAAHQRARNTALDDANKATRISERRIKDLNHERKPLLDEAEFYKGKPLPGKLKQALDANDAGIEAQEVLIENQKAEIVRINTRFDAELARLRKLWAGATPGSMAPLTELPKSSPPTTPKR
ncbi:MULTISPECIES: hypothetical protein [unclassified Roseateles]|uniref:hypothetical protein n=1 Tax=unclassified Roseateles TaxID=2626991 RepID=UPI0006FC19D9|nr:MULTISPECIES: hypothetical protein [unclassified Roseateles]KQW46618.1 hypothetical protein ASC81_09525 [Pelomonas sp. Root405]KRA73669.1 hypothetical protein ASD88_09525 [Pelomonas sp. Root662]